MLFRKLTLAVVFCLGTFTVQVASAFDLPSYFKSDKLLETPKIPHHSKAMTHFARVNNSGVRDVTHSMVKMLFCRIIVIGKVLNTFGAEIPNTELIVLRLHVAC